METLYGRNPKHIICKCNDEEANMEMVTISLNDRCPVCSSTRYIRIRKKEIQVREVPSIHSYTTKVA